jgi:Cu/Ag efflux pump CusA
MRLNTIMLTAAISIASTIPAFAHHGWGGNVDEVTAMTGMVTGGCQARRPARHHEDQDL